MNDLKVVKIKGDAIQPNKVLGASVKVYLKERANYQAAFHFKVIGCRTSGGVKYLDGYDVGHFNLSIEVNDIEFITIRC